MSGLEKLCLHGLPLSAINESLVSNENANKWAGNSFQGFSMALAIVALLSSVEMHWSWVVVWDCFAAQCWHA
jgi:hypothetical protein